jgi:hypothetical protein
LIVAAARANDGYPTWWISRDDGATWGRGIDVDRSGAMTGDDDAAFGPDGYTYALNLAFKNPPQQPSNPTVRVFSSRHGIRWRGPASFPPPHGLDQPDRPWLAADPYHPRRVYLANSEGAGDVVLWRSNDHARTFTGPTLVTGGEHSGEVELTSRPVFDTVRHDRMLMLYEASAPQNAGPGGTDKQLRDLPVTQLWLALSNDAGSTWTSHRVLDLVRAFGDAGRGGSLGHVMPALAIDRSGIVYAAVSARLGPTAQTHILLTRSTDHGRHWSRPVRVDAGRSASNVMPALAAGSRGRIALSWYSSPAPDYLSAHARWHETVALSTNAAARRPVFTQHRIGGLAHIGGVNTSGNPGSHLYDWGLRDFQSLTIDQRGMTHLAWTDDTAKGQTLTARQVSGPSLLRPDS